MKQQEQARKMQQIIAKARMDEGFKQRLLSNPAEVLKEEGLEIPSGVEVKILENTDKVFHLPLPAMPSADVLPEDVLSEDVLAVAAGGVGWTYHLQHSPGTTTLDKT